MKKRINRIQKTVKPTMELISNCMYLAKKVFLLM